MTGRQRGRLVGKFSQRQVLQVTAVCGAIAVVGAGIAGLLSATWGGAARLLAMGIVLAAVCVALALTLRRYGPASRRSGRPSPAHSPLDWQRVQDLLNQALELPSGERLPFIASASAGDTDLQDEVRSLLAAHARAGALDRPATDTVTGSFRLATGSFPSPGRIADRYEIPDKVGDGGMGEVYSASDQRLERIGHYEIIEQIGAGGMGVVYKARDTRLDRTVAIKSLPTLVLASDDARRRLVREARTAAAINHPNIATTHAVEEYDDTLYIVMELVDGSTLEALIGEGRPDVDTCIELVAQTAEGLGAAHARGIIHHDIKPSNLLATADGRVKITDFGIARQTTDAEHSTRTGSVLGTPAYMSPEQAEGQPAGPQADVWSLGVVLFTLLTGETPWGRGPKLAGSPRFLVTDPPFEKLPSDLPSAITAIVRRAMAWDPAERFGSGSEFAAALRAYQRAAAATTGADFPRLRRRRRIAAVAAFAVIVLAGVYLQRQSRVRWARAEAIPAIIELLADQRYLDAWLLVQEAEKYLGDDPHLQQLERTAALPRTILSAPEGAGVFVRDYRSDSDEWHYLGVTPLRDAFVPAGNLRWEVRRPGYRSAVGVFHVFLADTFRFDLRPETDAREMLFVSAGAYQRGGGALGGGAAPVHLDGFWLDRTEVTNAAYELFVSSGAYGDSTHWAGLPRENVASTWQDLVEAFSDATGRPGPAVWELGRYPDGTEHEPVRGVSWYEAAAYCASLGKALPTYHHWFRAASPGIYSDILLESNFGSSGPATVGSFAGMSRFGHLDMAGNVKEWTWTAVGRARYTLGGAWNDPAYLFTGSDARPPLDRSPTNGFRCAAYETPLDPALLAELPRLPRTSTAAVVSDEVFDVFRRLFAFDTRPLNSTVHGVDTSSPDWDVHLVSFDAAYGDERVLARLYFPKPEAAAPPYQTVIYFPASDGLTLRSSDGLTAQTFFDFVPRSGRVLVLPIYKGTYERYTGVAEPVTGAPTEQLNAWRDQVVQWVRDLRRTVDYLETRDDVDASRLAYLGLSLGGRYAPIFMALEDRFDAALVVSGGFSYASGLPDEILPIHYAPRTRVPTLMVSGSQDFTRPLETAIRPMFEAFGALESEKKLVLFPVGHLPPKNDLVRESFDWLDRYLGKVQRVR
jgi:formylglycine-generating enzyme required for sulfatase activity/tRNA A-37 threonylcarbamoyl transferase component Bud32